MSVRWRRIRAGEYESADGRWFVRSDAAYADDPDAGLPAAPTEWFLYDEGDNMIDGYPRLRDAKAAVERRAR